TPLIDQVEYKIVEDPYESNVTYKIYYLKVEQGEGDPVSDAEVAYITYETWRMRTGELLESTSSSQPKPFVMENKFSNGGLKEAVLEFNAADGFTENEDGTVSYDSYGIGAVFVPSGLAFFNNPP